jgi:hypothetical protein
VAHALQESSDAFCSRKSAQVNSTRTNIEWRGIPWVEWPTKCMESQRRVPCVNGAIINTVTK